MSLWIEEAHINESENHLISEPYIYETFAETPGELYRVLLNEYGRCEGKVYIDTEEGTKPIGWTFLKREKYEDVDDTYLHRTWISLVDGPAQVTRRVNYVEI